MFTCTYEIHVRIPPPLKSFKSLGDGADKLLEFECLFWSTLGREAVPGNGMLQKITAVW